MTLLVALSPRTALDGSRASGDMRSNLCKTAANLETHSSKPFPQPGAYRAFFIYDSTRLSDTVSATLVHWAGEKTN